MENASTQFLDWTGTIAIENIESRTRNINAIFTEVPKDERIIEITVSSENHRSVETETEVNVTVKTDKNKKYEIDMTIQEFMNMFLRFEIKLERK